MKKIVLFLMCTLFSATVFAQANVSWYDIYGSVVLKGGCNFLEKQPIAAFDLRADIGLIRAQIESDCTRFDGEEAVLFAFSPSIGLAYGNKHVAYFLVGGQPWGAVFTKDNRDKRRYNEWHVKLESGVDFRLSDLLFLNVGLSYLLPRQDTETLQHDRNLSLMAGLGFNF